jgi:hypothetical protein
MLYSDGLGKMVRVKFLYFLLCLMITGGKALGSSNILKPPHFNQHGCSLEEFVNADTVEIVNSLTQTIGDITVGDSRWQALKIDKMYPVEGRHFAEHLFARDANSLLALFKHSKEATIKFDKTRAYFPARSFTLSLDLTNTIYKESRLKVAINLPEVSLALDLAKVEENRQRFIKRLNLVEMAAGNHSIIYTNHSNTVVYKFMKLNKEAGLLETREILYKIYLERIMYEAIKNFTKLDGFNQVVGLPAYIRAGGPSYIQDLGMLRYSQVPGELIDVSKIKSGQHRSAFHRFCQMMKPISEFTALLRYRFYSIHNQGKSIATPNICNNLKMEAFGGLDLNGHNVLQMGKRFYPIDFN